MTSTIRVTFYGDKLSRVINHFSYLLMELSCIANKTHISNLLTYLKAAQKTSKLSKRKKLQSELNVIYTIKYI